MKPLIDCVGNASLTYVNYGATPVMKTMMGFSFYIALLSDRSPFFSTDSSESMLALVQQTSSYLPDCEPIQFAGGAFSCIFMFRTFHGCKNTSTKF